MMKDTQKYTRWTNDPDADDEEEEGLRVDAPLGNREDFDQMQEGRRALAMVTTRNPDQSLVRSRSAFARLLCTVVLLTCLCLTVGALLGYIISNKSKTSLSVQPCATTSSIEETTEKLNSETTTPGPSGTKSLPSDEFTTGAPKSNFNEFGDIETMASSLKAQLSPDLLHQYVRNFSSVHPENLLEFVYSVFSSFGFTIVQRAFPVITSSADRANPNTVEVMVRNGSYVKVNNETASLNRSLPFAGFSPNATVEGQLLFANFATEHDLDGLVSRNLSIEGSVLLVRIGAVHPSAQVEAAAKRGAAAVILYPDPAHFGNGFGNESYPDGRSLPTDGVVWQNLKLLRGDPSTPFYTSQRGVYRVPDQKNTAVTQIPVQPVNLETAELLRGLLQGNDSAPIGWNSTDFADGVTVRLKVNNVIGEDSSHALAAFSPAMDHSKTVLVGTHYEVRDSRLTSSGIGLASLLTLAHALHYAYPNGTSRRVAFLVFGGKDCDFSAGNEFAQLFTPWLESTAIAYLDMTTILEGSGFLKAAVSPVLRGVVRESLLHVSWPQGEGLNVNQGLTKFFPLLFLYHAMSKIQRYQRSFEFSIPSVCSESFNFVNIHGIPSIQLASINPNKNVSFFLKNSQYDTTEALISLEDKELAWTHMITSVFGVATMILSSADLPPVHFKESAWDIKNAWKNFLQEEKVFFNNSPTSIQELADRITTSLESFVLLTDAQDSWYQEGTVFEEEITAYQKFRKVEDRLQRLVQFGRRFLRPRNFPRGFALGSLVTYGPSTDDPCQTTHFPFVRRVLKEVREGRLSFNILSEELSLLLSLLADITIDI